MTTRLWSLVLPLALFSAACGGDGDTPDAGARPDAGFFIPADVGPRDARVDAGPVVQPDADPVVNPDADPVNPDADPVVNPDADPVNPDADEPTMDSGAPDAQPGNPDAQPGNPDAQPGNPDATPMNPDATPMNPDATPPLDTGVRDTGLLDAGGLDAAPNNPDAQPGNPDAAPGNPDAAAGTDAGVPVAQGGGLLITEIVSRSTTFEWIEITNTTAAGVNLANYTIGSLSRGAVGLVAVRAPTDPTGALGTAVNIPAGTSVVGVANPTNAANIPAVARFVIGAPGQLGTDWLADGGDVVTLRSPGNAGDVVDFRAAATNPANAIGATEFPLITDVSTQLDLPIVGPGGELGNDNGGVWCAPLFRGPTPNAANRACNAHVISEVTYDYGSPASGADDGYEFIEIAGNAGGSLAGVFVGFVEGSGAAVGGSNGTSIAITGTRMPLDGLYVLADRAPAMMTSFVANVDQAEEIGSGSTSAMENGPDAIQLYRQNADLSFTGLDAFAYDAVPAGLLDTTRMLPAIEGLPVVDIAAGAYPANYARSDDEVDTNDNRADFGYLPTATPGVRNGSGALVVTSLVPADAIVGTTATVTFSGTNFTDQMTIVFGQTPAPTITNQTVTVSNQLTARVRYPTTGPGTAERVSVTLNGRNEFGRTYIVNGGFTWTTANNELDVPNECDFCNLQFPGTLTLAPGATSALVFGQIYEGGRTDTTMGGAAPNVLAELGWGPAGSDPRTRNWTWRRATFNVESGNNDEYRATLVAPAVAGTYAYTYRFSLDGGLTWSYADLNGAGSNTSLGFALAQLGVLTVQ